MNDVLERIEEMRKEKGITQYVLCKGVGINQSTYSTWLAKDRIPKPDALEKIADFLNVTYADLMGWDAVAIEEAEIKKLERIYCASFVNRWKDEIGETEFSDSEWEELSNYVKFMIAKR